MKGDMYYAKRKNAINIAAPKKYIGLGSHCH